MGFRMASSIVLIFIIFSLSEAKYSSSKKSKYNSNNYANCAYKPCRGTVPLHRYYNGATVDHFYTTNFNELGGGKDGYTYEGVQANILPNAATCSLPLYRYWNEVATDHFYTTNFGELGGGKDGYVSEGLAGYLYPTPVSGTVPLYRYYNAGSVDHFYTTNWEELGGGKSGFVFEGIAGYVCNATTDSNNSGYYN